MVSSKALAVASVLCFLSLAVPQARAEPLVLNQAQKSSLRTPTSLPPQPRQTLSSRKQQAPTGNPGSKWDPRNPSRKAIRANTNQSTSPRSAGTTHTGTKTTPAVDGKHVNPSTQPSRARTGSIFPIFAAAQGASTSSPAIWNQLSNRLFSPTSEFDDFDPSVDNVDVRKPEDIDVARAYKSPKHLAELVKTFCTNNKIFLERQILKTDREEAQKLIEEARAQITILENKARELKAAKAEEDANRKLIRDKLIGIFNDMKPEAAAQQLMAMDDSRVAIVLSSMPARTASQILNEMNPKRAAQVTAAMLSQGKTAREK